MGLDTSNFIPLGGFDGLLEKVKTGNIVTSGEEDFRFILEEILVEGRDAKQTIRSLSGRSKLVEEEIMKGINTMTEEQREEITDLLKKGSK